MTLVKDTRQPRPARDYNAKAARAKLMARDTVDARRGARTSRPTTCAHGDDKMDLLHLPHVVDHELRRLPSADRGQLEDRAPALRGRRDAQLRDLQPAGRARRHVPARPPRPGEGQQDRAGALVLGAGAVVDQHQPRAHLHPAAADRGERLSARRRSRRTTRTPSARPRPRPAPTATCRSDNDNNAIMAQLLLHGTNFVNFVGFNAWVGERAAGRGGAGHRVGRAAGGDRQLPAPLRLSRLVSRRTRSAAASCSEAHDHGTRGAARCLQLRGEYLYVAEGAGGMRVYDVASIANKGVSQRIITAPFSPLGQDTHVASQERDLRRAADQPADRTRCATRAS